jgi:hypothetical protein
MKGFKTLIEFGRNEKGVEWGVDLVVCQNCRGKYKIHWTDGGFYRKNPKRSPSIYCPNCKAPLGKWPAIRRIVSKSL